MDDDQSMRDRVAGRYGPDDQAAEGPEAGAAQAGPAQAGPGQAGPAPAGPDPAGHGKPEAGKPEAGKGKSGRSFWTELALLIVLAMVIALVIKTFVVQAFYIPSSSMEDTLLIGDKVLVSKLVYHFRSIQPGDVIVFDGAGSWDPVTPAAPRSSDPAVRLYDVTLRPLFRSVGGLFGTAPGQTDFIKRVIGVPGDHVACCNARGLVTVNGVALHESSYLYPGAAPSQIRFHVTVPRGRLWVMGDNRLVSDDSRLRRYDPGSGTIPENKVIGRAFLIVWPPSRWRVLRIPATFGQHGISRPPAAAAAGAAGAAAAAGGVAVRAGSSAGYLPLAGGLAVALPLTWLERRVRLRRRRVLRRR